VTYLRLYAIINLCNSTIALFVSAAFPLPAAAGTAAGVPNSKLTITNKSAGPLTVILKGPKSYTIYAAVGKTTQEIMKGDYVYEYKACGVTKTGKLPAKGAQAKLNILACKTASITIANYGNGNMSVSLSGTQNYSFNVGEHTTVKQTILEGEYRWKISASCGSKSGTLYLKGKKNVFWARCS
jgi:hypothetical protein